MKKLVLVFIVIGMMLFTIIVATAHPFGTIDTPSAVKGKLDLSEWELDTHGEVLLQGEWELYNEQLLTPEDIHQAELNRDASGLSGYVDPTKPRSFKQMITSEPGTGIGVRTYRMTVTLPEGHDPSLAIKVANVQTSSILYVNGREVGGQGIVSSHPSEQQASYKSYNAYFTNDSNELDIVLQVSNLTHYGYHLNYSIWLGKAETISSQTSNTIAIELCGVVLCFIIFLYHLYIAIYTRSLASLYFSLIFMFMALLFLVTGEMLILLFTDTISHEVFLKLQWLGRNGIRIALQLYLMRELKTLMPKRINIAILISYVSFLGVIMLLDSSVYSKFADYARLYYVLVLFYTLWCLSKEWLMRRKFAHHERSTLFYIVIVICWSISNVNNTLYSVGLVSNKMIGSVATGMFILLSQMLLAISYTRNVERVQRVDKIKRDYLLSASYNMKAPLESMHNMTVSMLKREQKGDETVQTDTYIQAKMMNQLTKRIIRHIHALVDLTLLKNNELKLNVEPIMLRSSLERAIEAVHGLDKKQSIKVKLNVDAGIIVYADEERIHQVLYEIIQQLSSRISTSELIIRAERSGQRITITMHDNGDPLSAEAREKIFRPSFNIDADYGLNFFHAREIVQAMRGRLTLDSSAEGEGNTLHIVMQGYYSGEGVNTAEQEQLIEIRTESLLPAWYELGEHQVQQQTILIVDTLHYHIVTLREILIDYQVVYAYSSEEALHILKTYPVDLVMIDMATQGQTGLSLCREIREQYLYIELPIIFMTAGIDHTELEQGLEAGANDYIRKPFIEREVATRVKSLLNMRSAMKLAVEHELAFLQAQIQPHFIYNAMNTMISLCYIDPSKAAELLTDFSQYLRIVLDVDTTGSEVTIRQELELIQIYVNIERARFGDKYKLVLDVPEHLKELRIPSLSVQPLVENAIKHGLYSKLHGGSITVRMSLKEQVLSIVVSDDGVGMTEEKLQQLMNTDYKTGVGFSNIQKRIKQLRHASLSVHSELGKGTAVTITFSVHLTN